jgi:bacterial leucyl aminopeptidase
LFSRIQNLASTASQHLNVSVSQFKHSWDQHSIIARISTKPDLNLMREPIDDKPVVIVGAHLDSINQLDPYFGRSPGVDDDGSGTTTTLEAFKLLIASSFRPSRPIEFHWYSAEEIGLLGSQAIAIDYASRSVDVVAMFQVDMTGFTSKKKKEVIGVASDYVDSGYVGFLRKIALAYCNIPAVDTKCEYACSDHASWTRNGYASVFTFETRFEDHSKFIHTPNDDLTHVSFDHMKEFVKMVLGWAVELSA